MNKLKIFIALAALASFSFSNPETEPRKIRVVLDAGHGGNDYGAMHAGLTEKQLTAQIARKIQEANRHENIDIHVTRTDDKALTLGERAEMINSLKPDLVISLHVNHNQNAAISGFEIYTPKADNTHQAESSMFATRLADKLSKTIGTNRGIKEAPFFILNKSKSPAILVELGFLSNLNDRILLTDEISQESIANAILEFLSEID